MVALLVQNLERLDESVKEEADGVHNTLGKGKGSQHSPSCFVFVLGLGAHFPSSFIIESAAVVFSFRLLPNCLFRNEDPCVNFI